MKLIVKQPPGEQITADFLNSGPHVENSDSPALATFRPLSQGERQAFESDILIFVVTVAGQVSTQLVAAWLYDHLKERFSRRAPRDIMLGSDHLDFNNAKSDETRRRIAARLDSSKEED